MEWNGQRNKVSNTIGQKWIKSSSTNVKQKRNEGYKSTSQTYFFGIFGIKINAKLKWTKYGQTSNSIQINFNKSN